MQQFQGRAIVLFKDCNKLIFTELPNTQAVVKAYRDPSQGVAQGPRDMSRRGGKIAPLEKLMYLWENVA